MEKDAAGYPQGHTNPGTSRTSPAAYPTLRVVLRGLGSSNAPRLPGRGSSNTSLLRREFRQMFDLSAGIARFGDILT